MFSNLWKKNSKDFFLVLLLVSLSFYAWHFLPTWIIQRQGFMYFDPRTINTYLDNPLGLLSTAQVAGVLLSATLVKIVGVNMPLYMWIQLIGMLSIGVLFYCVMKVITKNYFIAFSASLMYTISYFGNFAMYMVDYSAHFLERASVNVIFLLLSFLFLHLFLEKTKQKYFIISLACYFLGILLSHFSILLTGPYFFYPFFWNIFNKKSILKGFGIGISYVLISGFFIYLSSIGVDPILRKHVGFLQFILHPQKYQYLEGILIQLAYWSQYPSIIKAIFLDIPPLSLLNPIDAAPLKPFIATVYLAIIVLIYKTLANKRTLLLTAVFGTVSIFLFNLYLGRYDPFNSGDTNRYLYFPTFLLVIFWSIFLWVLLKNKNIGLKIAGAILLISYCLINMRLLSINFAISYANTVSQRAIYNHIIKTRNKLKPNTLVIAPYPDIAQYEGPFFTYQLGNGQVTYLSASANISNWPDVASSSSHIISLKYSNECQCVLEKTLK